ncbi:MAG: carbon-nitrogen hydrolase family protein [Gammaproteobacteria bacterium]
MSKATALTVALVQMNSGQSIKANLAQADHCLKQAAGQGAQLAILPENFAAMGAAEEFRRQVAEVDGQGPIQDALADLARSNGLWLVGGTFPLVSDADSRPVAACCVYDSVGERRGRYDKVHLFDVHVPDSDEQYCESANTAPGRQPLTVPTPWGRLGVAVCYDLRFPELFGLLAADGAELIAVPAAFTRPTGRAHWELLIRARALDSLAYVAAAAQTGTHPGGRRTWGHSLVAGPWGDVLCHADESPGVHLVTLDMTQPATVRKKFPVLQHRRFQTALKAAE